LTEQEEIALADIASYTLIVWGLAAGSFYRLSRINLSQSWFRT
jgi:hypothetical protein